MSDSERIVLYSIMSALIWLLCYNLAKRFSGARFKWRWFWLCLILTLVVGGFHLEMFRNGAVLLAGRRFTVIEDSFAVELVSLVGFVFQVMCIPRKYEPRRWLTKR